MLLTLAVLQELLSSDSGIRSQAETVFHSIELPKRIQDLTNHLLVLSSSSLSTSTTNTSSNDAVIVLSAVLLRRDILKLTDPYMLSELVTPLLQCYNGTKTSADGSKKLQIGHCLAEICSSLSILNGNTTASTPILVRIVASINPREDESLRFMAIFADRAPLAFAQVVVPSLFTLPSQCNLTLPTTIANLTRLIVNAAIATTVQNVSLVALPPNLDELTIDANSPAAALGETCLFSLLGPIFNCTDELAQLECLQCLSQAAVICPSFLAGRTNVLQSTVDMCLGLAHRYTKDADQASVALNSVQVLSTLLSVANVRHDILTPSMAQTVAQQAIPVCVQIMVQKIDQDSIQAWALESATLIDDTVDNDDDDDALFAESLMENLLLYLATPALNVVMPLVQQMLQSTDDWRNVRAGLATLEACLVATPLSLAQFVPDVVKAATTVREHIYNPRVQYQAVRLLGALCETHPSVRELYGQVILSPMIKALSSPVSKVSAMASMGVVAYCRGNADGRRDDDLDAPQFLIPYLAELIQSLLHPLSVNEFNVGSVTVKVRAMNAVSCLAQASAKAFEPFYSQIKAGLMTSMQVPQEDIATAALQSLTIVGQAVGKDLFLDDATMVLSWVIPLMGTEKDSNFPSPFSIEVLLTACARISSVLEEDFAPFIDAVLPIVYKQAEEVIDCAFLVTIRVMTPKVRLSLFPGEDSREFQ
jgi:hypothetical protein